MRRRWSDVWRVHAAALVALGVAALLPACTPDAPTAPGVVTPTVGDAQPSDWSWIGTIEVSYRSGWVSHASEGDTLGHSETDVTYTIAPGQRSYVNNPLLADWSATHSQQTHFDPPNCGGFGTWVDWAESRTTGQGSGGRTGSLPDGTGPLGVYVVYTAPGASYYNPGTPSGFQILALNGNTGSGITGYLGHIPTSTRSWGYNCIWEESFESTSTSNALVGGGARAFVERPADDYVLAGEDSSGSLNADGIGDLIEMRYRLRRDDCTGVPDSDSDGFDDCAEFDANTDWEDRSSRPPSTWDTDADGVVDPKDWCPRERPELLLLGTPPVFDDPEGDGCPKGRGPYHIDIVPTDWRGPFRIDAQASTAFPYARSATYAWSFGTGTAKGTGKAAATAHWAYQQPGTYPISVTISDPSGRRVTVTPPEPFTLTGNPYVDFAPEVRLDDREDNFPMDPYAFIDLSELRWNRCITYDALVVERGAVQAGRLGKASGATSYRSPESCVNALVPAWEQTRPYTDSHIEALTDGEGFNLDFDEHEDTHQHFQSNIPVWYESGQQPGTGPSGPDVVTYWFFYGYNNAPGGFVGGAADDHEGDWEQINVELDITTRVPTRVIYFTHGEVSNDNKIAFADNTKMQRSGFLHPVVFAADGSHASYPHPGEELDLTAVPWPDDRANGNGERWQTWKTGVYRAADAAWFGFGGAWGEVGAARPEQPAGPSHTTGPMGPGEWKPRYGD